MKWQLLHHACWNGDAEEVRRLLDAGANPNQVAPTNWRQTPLGEIWRGATPLMMATGHAGHFEVADALVAAGADVNRGLSILHADWHWQHLLPALRYLHGKGWDVSAADAKGQTALHQAAFCGYARVVRALLALGATHAPYY